ncbi:type II toxin-antitoxin system prevent-host-death family antitoxin [Acidobacteria bacterium AH-259-O06]|nr:type II toxin-antitoxin system prevent-host-death family antitoxin [Acidobacteria bacterium AH-259-O06]
MVVNIHQAKTHLSRLLDRAAKGEEIIIARNDRPIAKLVPITGRERRPGRLKGKIRISPDFDAPLPAEIQAAFEGDED